MGKTEIRVDFGKWFFKMNRRLVHPRELISRLASHSRHPLKTYSHLEETGVIVPMSP